MAKGDAISQEPGGRPFYVRGAKVVAVRTSFLSVVSPQVGLAAALLRKWRRPAFAEGAQLARMSTPAVREAQSFCGALFDDQDEANQEEDWWTSFEPDNEVGV